MSIEYSRLSIVFEDQEILVINKPCGLIVNRSLTSPTNTLQDMLYTHLGILESTTAAQDTDFYARAGIVHRLDKDTSGVLIVAKTPTTFAALQKQFKDRLVQKEYVAIVHGNITDALIEIDAPLIRNPLNRLKYAIGKEGKPAFTKIVKETSIEIESNNFCFVTVFPKTGRTHQIRVHLAAIKHPIVGDKIYATRKQLELAAKYFDRMMLHAKKLVIFHPLTAQRMEFTAEVPKEFYDYCPGQKNH